MNITNMILEDYFDIQSQEDIRLKGTRIGIETILEDYLDGSSPEEIAARYRNLSLEQVYATITYYHRYRSKVDSYLQAWRKHTDSAAHRQDIKPSETVRRLRQLRKEQIEVTGA